MDSWHGTTIVSVRRGAQVALGGDGQVTLGAIVVKSTARKVRKIHHDRVLAGFAGATADAFTLFERLERKLEAHQGQLLRAAVELAKDWRTDKFLRNLEAMMIVADKDVTLILTGNGDVLEPENGVAAIIVMMIGRFARPAFTGLHPYANWKCRISPNITPAIAIAVPICAMDAPRTVPLEKSLRSSIGSEVRRSCQTNPIPATTAPTTEATVAVESQP